MIQKILTVRWHLTTADQDAELQAVCLAVRVLHLQSRKDIRLPSTNAVLCIDMDSWNPKVKTNMPQVIKRLVWFIQNE